MITRLITAMVLAPLVLAVTLFGSSVWFLAMLLLAAGLGLIEWCLLNQQSPPTIGVAVIAFSALVIVLYQAADKMLILIPVLATAYWVWQLLDMWRNQLGKRRAAWLSIAEGVFVLSSATLSLVLMHRNENHGPVVTLVLFLIIWAADSCAYFSGRAFGKNKLAPKISPGKTIEGALGGLLGTLLITAIALPLSFNFNNIQIVGWLSATVAAVLFSIVGDLNESRLKRLSAVKDSGSLLPGHGGILDRIDGLLAGAPVFVTLLVGFGVLT